MAWDKWDRKHRPRRFEDVHGQTYAVRFLSGLVLRKTGGRNLLLRGAVGSGKTTLVRILAQALNCSNTASSGSPCGVCSSCSATEEYFFEFDVAGSGDRVGDWIREWNRPHHHKVRVVFLDEAHSLSSAMQNSALKAIEEPAPGVIFCLATAEEKKFIPAFESRFAPVRIHPLNISEAVGLLEKLAVKEGIQYDLQALYLLAAAKPPHARDLTIGLEQLAGLGERVTAELVEEVFDLDVRGHLSQYMLALADGDRAALTEVLKGWGDGVATKIKWVNRFLAATYYNDVLGQDVVVDALVHSMEDARWEFVKRLRARLPLETNEQLELSFVSMLTFWCNAKWANEVALDLNLALFESIVLRGPSNVDREQYRGANRKKQSSVSSVDRVDNQHVSGDWERSPSVGRYVYMGREDVREIINRTSFFTQQYGISFNRFFRIEYVASEKFPENYCVSQIERISREIAIICESHSARFASITHLERDGDAIVGRILAYIAPDQGFDGALTERFERIATRDGAVIESEKSENSIRHRFQWAKVLEICAGYSEEEETPGAGDDLRAALKIPFVKWRTPGPINCPILMYSPLLGSAAISAECSNGMTPLSAYDAGHMDWIGRGWEMDEFSDREMQATRRMRRVSDLADRYASDPTVRDREIAGLQKRWSSRPAEQRSRTWRGWWR